MFQLTLVGAQLSTAMTDAATPRLAQACARGQRGGFWSIVAKLSIGSLALGLLGLGAAVVCGRRLLLALYHPEYASQIDVLLWVTASCPFQYLGGVLGVAVTSMRRLHEQVPFRLINLAVTYGLCRYLIAERGIVGAGEAVFGSSVVFAATTALLMFVCSTTSRAEASAALASSAV
jgi:O-antigen/teichoic acid export membrane protein